jgi:hypothetical protein
VLANEGTRTDASALQLSPATYKAFGKDQLAKMKDGAVLVNTARCVLPPFKRTKGC